MTLDYWVEPWVETPPRKGHQEDAGIDLAISRVLQVFRHQTTCYDTGIHFRIPQGCWLLLAARSSLAKTGYILSNSVGIIDNGYRGSIKVCLTKIDSTYPDLVLPLYCVQVIPIASLDVSLRSIVSDCRILEETSRADGSFGSTDVERGE
jgi:dUTP pyrophosphatase